MHSNRHITQLEEPSLTILRLSTGQAEKEEEPKEEERTKKRVMFTEDTIDNSNLNRMRSNSKVSAY